MTNDSSTFSCGDLEQVLPAAWKGELGRQELDALEQHLASCGQCRALATGLEDAWTLAKREAWWSKHLPATPTLPPAGAAKSAPTSPKR